ncbi:MAG: tRNA pseudouridine(38-40) synthase TruA [Clostridiales bacterium]|nr:tRNA pseudouridine(38-40) synthase TruA [Clostridiales bacterium]
MRYVMKIAYDGTNYAGWQRQKNAVSIQEKAELAVLDALGVKVNITASGRTDAGVHAAGQVCQFDADLTVPPEKMPDCLNRYLPEDIRIVDGWQGADDFDCNRSAKRKTYCYSLYVSGRDMPLKDRYATRVENAPSLEILQAAAKLFEGEHDFKAFCASGSSVKTTVRTVYEVRVEESQSYHSRDLKIYVTGNGFLYNMVRTLVGELLDIASNRKTQESLKQAFASGKRELLGKTMPAKGLTLVDVCYEEK